MCCKLMLRESCMEKDVNFFIEIYFGCTFAIYISSFYDVKAIETIYSTKPS